MTLSGFKSNNHPQQVGRRGADDLTDDRRTPDWLFDEWNAECRFTLDVAASADNARCEAFFDVATDGLKQSWAGHRVWCNPPYSDCARWVDKAWDEIVSGCDLIVMLLPANRTEQGWWQSSVEPYRERVVDNVRLSLTFLPGRIRFMRPGWTKPAKGDRPPFGLCILKWESVSATRQRPRAF